MFPWKEWVKMGAVAATGGALTGGLAAALDPRYFNVHDWVDEKHVAIMAMEGAAVALGGLFMKSPMGYRVLEFFHHSQQQQIETRAAIEKLKGEMGKPLPTGPFPSSITEPPPTGPPPPTGSPGDPTKKV